MFYSGKLIGNSNVVENYKLKNFEFSKKNPQIMTGIYTDPKSEKYTIAVINFIYSEERKTLVYALQQIQSGGIARTGQGAAVLVVVMVVPIAIFIFSESQILETMASSGLKD